MIFLAPPPENKLQDKGKVAIHAGLHAFWVCMLLESARPSGPHLEEF